MNDYKFIATGVVCDINDDKADIERNVQYVIDERCGGYAKFRYEKLADNKVRLIYFRDLIYPNGHRVIYDADISHVSPSIPILNGAYAKVNYKDNKGNITFILK